MMGNEGSQLSGLELDERNVEVTDGWTLHSGTFRSDNNPNLCVFISEVLNGSGGNAVILERAAKNLMLYRHPCILKFISHWSKSGRIHLATEEVKPLASIITNQTSLQICIGLHNILKALIFLHEKALSSHNNVCCAAVYVTPDGTWKLGGLEYLCRFTDLTPRYLEEARARRYEKAVPPEEDSMKSSSEAIPYPTSVDQYGFGVLVEEVLHKKTDSDIPALQEFREICKKQLQSSEPSLRPNLTTLLNHVFFTHKFITIQSFLVELPLKCEVEKHEFFRSLVDQLTTFPEKLVAMQLGSLLLSRMVLLDSTAQEILLPRILCPKSESGDGTGIFTLTTYKEYVVPRLLQMFCVRDAQIRLLLLAHFASFCNAFSESQLRTLILPELLVGIKDTNEQLVSVTLRALADLVPILGAAIVIGGKRAKLFTDGRPKARHHSSNSIKTLKSPSRSTPNPAPIPVGDTDSTSFVADLPERPSPDGGEDHTPTTDDETEAWSDWDVPENNVENLDDADVNIDDAAADISEPTSIPKQTQTEATPTSKQELPDISQLDIKNSVTSVKTQEEYDFFQDMEPVISKTHVLQINEEVKNSDDVISSKHCLELNYIANDGEGEGWGDDIEDWGDINEGNSTVS